MESTPPPDQDDSKTSFRQTRLATDDWGPLIPNVENKEVITMPRVVSTSSIPFDFTSAIPEAASALQSIVDDGFTNCFNSMDTDHWNWNVYLFPQYVAGVILRYVFMLPFRMIIFFFGTSSLVITFLLTNWILKRYPARRLKLQRWLLVYLARLWLLCFNGVIKYGGVMPIRRPNQIFVCNHTSPLPDVLILSSHRCFSVIGQNQPGILGWLQKHLLYGMGSIWFERWEAKDRKLVARRIKEHMSVSTSNPLLIFPEGVCVNNNSVLQFKKGAFDMGATVCPVAIRYNKTFSDPYWNSRRDSFGRHMFNLMRAWALVADVWFLEPQTIRPGESAQEFAGRVRDMIARTAHLDVLDLDGYLKYNIKKNPTVTMAKRRKFAIQAKIRLSSNIKV